MQENNSPEQRATLLSSPAEIEVVSTIEVQVRQTWTIPHLRYVVLIIGTMANAVGEIAFFKFFKFFNPVLQESRAGSRTTSQSCAMLTNRRMCALSTNCLWHLQ